MTFVDAKPGMRDERPKRREGDRLDWKTVAPRWMLLTALMLMCSLAGALLIMVREGASKDQQRLEAAINDIPSKYQARLSERVAVAESQINAIMKSVDGLTYQVDQQNKATAELTTQLKLMTSELKKARVENEQK